MKLDRRARVVWLGYVAPLRALAEGELERLAEHTVLRTLHRGDALIRQGEPFDALGVVVSGSLDVAREQRGRRLHLRRLSPRAWVGLSLVAGAAASAHVVAAERETRVLLVPGKAVREALARDPAASLGALTALAGLVDRLSEELVDAQTLPLEERVHRHLARRAEGRREVSITQQEIADALGASRERVNRALSALARRGLLTLARGRVRF